MAPKVHKGLLATGTLSLSMLFAGCTSTSLINENLFHNASDMEGRVEALPVGSTFEEVKDAMNIGERYFYRLSREEILRAHYGAEPRIDLSENALDDLDFSGVEGYRIDYENVTESWRFSTFGTHTNVRTEGERMHAVFIFEDDKLVETIMTGGYVNARERNSNLPSAGKIMDHAM